MEKSSKAGWRRAKQREIITSHWYHCPHTPQSETQAPEVSSRRERTIIGISFSAHVWLLGSREPLAWAIGGGETIQPTQNPEVGVAHHHNGFVN